jgi:hypothetical protein
MYLVPTKKHIRQFHMPESELGEILTRPTTLSRCLDFTEEDLAANQQSRLSVRQSARLRRGIVNYAIVGGSFFLVFGYVFITLFVHGIQIDLADVVLIVVVVLLTLMFGIGTWLEVSKRWSDLRKGVVLSVTGIAEPYIRSRVRGIEYHSLKIAGLDFQLPDPTYHAFYSGNRYQIFYTPRVKFIVSAVRLDEPDALIPK